MLKIGLIGCGKMGGALLRGVGIELACKEPVQIAICDAYPAAMHALREELPGEVLCGTAVEVFQVSEFIVLAVKPADLRDVCLEFATQEGERLFVSIAAGVRLAEIEGWLGGRHRVVRVMPNTPVLVGAGASAYACGQLASTLDAELVERIFGSVGTAIKVSETALDAVTGLSGSGPAFVYTVIEALIDAGVLMGLTREVSRNLAAQTVLGAAKMVIETGKHPGVLRDEVTSPGGTTVAGLEVLEAHAVRHAFLDAVRAATERSKELGT